MSYQLSIWLDDKTARDLETLSDHEDRKRSAMVKVLIRRAARELTQIGPAATTALLIRHSKCEQEGLHVTR